jgi:hypothetical protein
MAVLTPVLTGGNGIPTYNIGMAETYSWIPIQNDQNRQMYARAGYITNLKDLQISLSASNLNIGTVHLQDGQDGSLASVVQAGTKYALLVQNQDLISTIDSITIGDNKGNLATVTASSLNVYNTNPVTTVSATILNSGSLSATIINPQVEITNDTGNSIPVTGIVQISSVNISDANWLFQVGRGKIAGATLKSFTGYCSAVGGTFQPIWEYSIYTFLTSAQQLRLWSKSNSDTNVSVYIDGLDVNYNPINETLVLTNGTTGILTVNNYYRINGISLTRTPMAVGEIDLGTSDKTNILASIEVGTDRSSMTVYTVPNGYTFYLERVNAFCNYVINNQGNNNNSPVNACYRSYTTNNGLTTTILQSPFYSNYSSVRISPRSYSQKTDCQWQCKADTGFTLIVGLQVEGILISNSVL